MKWIRNPSNLPLLCGGLGAVGMGLRWWMLATGFDEKGLLTDNHIVHGLLLLVSAAAVAILIAALWSREDSRKSAGMFSPSVLGAVAAGVGCLGIAMSAWAIYAQPQTLLNRITWILGGVSVLATVFLAWCRAKGLRPHFLAHSLVTVYLMFHLVYHYQQWFPQTQLALYLPQLLAQVLLILAFYHRTALESNMGGRRAHLFTSQFAGFLCLLAIPGANNPLFYLTMAFWMLADTGKLQLPRKEGEESR